MAAAIINGFVFSLIEKSLDFVPIEEQWVLFTTFGVSKSREEGASNFKLFIQVE